MAWYSVTWYRDKLSTWLKSWPCHGIPDTASRIWAQWDSEGNLVDYDIIYSNGRLVNESKLDISAAALIALITDMQREIHPEHCRF